MGRERCQLEQRRFSNFVFVSSNFKRFMRSKFCNKLKDVWQIAECLKALFMCKILDVSRFLIGCVMPVFFFLKEAFRHFQRAVRVFNIASGQWVHMCLCITICASIPILL